jgi:hypothetical protein
VVVIEWAAGLRQVNGVDQEIAAYRFAARPASLRAQLIFVDVLTHRSQDDPY